MLGWQWGHWVTSTIVEDESIKLSRSLRQVHTPLDSFPDTTGPSLLWYISQSATSHMSSLECHALIRFWTYYIISNISYDVLFRDIVMISQFYLWYPRKCQPFLAPLVSSKINDILLMILEDIRWKMPTLMGTPDFIKNLWYHGFDISHIISHLSSEWDQVKPVWIPFTIHMVSKKPVKWSQLECSIWYI